MKSFANYGGHRSMSHADWYRFKALDIGAGSWQGGAAPIRATQATPASSAANRPVSRTPLRSQ